MRFYKELNENGWVVAVGTGLGHIEITEEEYNTLRGEMYEKSELTDKVYWGRESLENVPAEWRDEVLYFVNKCVAEMGTAEEQEIPAAEALDIILGGVG